MEDEDLGEDASYIKKIRPLFNNESKRISNSQDWD